VNKSPFRKERAFCFLGFISPVSRKTGGCFPKGDFV